jgi:hypothetical protein
MKNMGLCKILRKFEKISYEIEFPDDMGISPIFNVAYMYPYREDKLGGVESQKEILMQEHHQQSVSGGQLDMPACILKTFLNFKRRAINVIAGRMYFLLMFWGL